MLQLLKSMAQRHQAEDVARLPLTGNRGEDMNEKHEEMAHRSIAARTANARNQ